MISKVTAQPDEAVEPVLTRATRARRDLTIGPLGRLILALALPSAAESALFSVSGLLHAFWLGQLGGTALAAATIGTTLRIVLISPMMGLSVGGMAVVARHVGAHEGRDADRGTLQTVVLIVLFIVPLMIIGMLWGGTFLRWMGAEGVLWEESLAYLRIILFGLFFMECLPTLNVVIRGAGHPEQTLYINVVNVVTMAVLEPVLVLGWGPAPALGVRGAAWAAVLSSAAGVAAQFYVLARGTAGLHLHLRDVWPHPATMKRILKVALPTTAQRFSPNLANAILVRLISSFGSEVLTAYSVMTQVSTFLQGPALGVANAVAAMVGQNLGARQPQRAERATWLGVGFALAASTVAFIALLFTAWPVFGLLNNEVVIQVAVVGAVPYFMLLGLGNAWNQVVGAALGGAGDALANMLISMGVLWLVQLPLCWALSRGLGLGPAGIWLGLGLSAVIAGAALSLRFKQGWWKGIVV